MNLIFHASDSILAEKGSFCLKQRCFPAAPSFQIYCDLNKKNRERIRLVIKSILFNILVASLPKANFVNISLSREL